MDGRFIKKNHLECPICYLDQPTKQQPFIQLVCGHIVCEYCLKQSLKSRYRKCGLCRNPITWFLKNNQIQTYYKMCTSETVKQ